MPGRAAAASVGMGYNRAMSFDDQSTPLPESFLRLHSGWRGKLLRPLAELRERHELCEDLANHLVASAQALQHDVGLSEDEVLQRCHQGLAQPEAGLAEGEPAWVVCRLAELLRWPLPHELLPPSPGA